jgi:uncharacterized protein YndB with AHSA1/START domain
MDITKEIDIAAPPEAVYEYLRDFTRHSEWTTPSHGVSITADDQALAAVGSRFTSDAHQMGAQHDRLNVTELVPPRLIVYEVTMKDGNTFRHTFEIEARQGGTHLKKRFQSLKLSLLSKLMALVAATFLAPRLLAGDVERIKERMERPAGLNQ